MDNNGTIDFLGMINQAADMAMDKLLMEMAKDTPILVGMIKLLNEFGIRGVRAYEFITKMSAICSFFDTEGKKE